MTGAPAPDPLGHELLQEKAANLARLGERLERALAALAAHDAGGGAAHDPTTRARLVDAAGEALWYYVVQREVSGLLRHDGVLVHLRVPREVLLRMGFRPTAPAGRS